jgi:hypothetical protein
MDTSQTPDSRFWLVWESRAAYAATRISVKVSDLLKYSAGMGILTSGRWADQNWLFHFNTSWYAPESSHQGFE